ncbi:MAG: AAC(3)-I family aminoglycoside N-acetyltransferase [Alphaproteobacteria bacterium]|nr:AAC(3)-I family aminoglycoside N-acetyltransferase [Alphaproteobacteria bacterium]
MSNSGSFTIRRLGTGDIALMRAVSAMFGEAFEERDTYTGRPPDDGYLARLLARDHVVVLAALQDGVVAGGLFAYVLAKFEQAREEVFIYDLAVAEAHRRRGIARALIEETRRIAAARGAHVVFIQTEPDNHAAVALYSKLGVREDTLHFDIPIDQ